MDNFDKPLSEVFDLTKHPWLERTGVAVAFNLTSLAVLGLFVVERFGVRLTGVVEFVDRLQAYLFFGHYLFFMSVLMATILVLVPLLALFKAYEWLTADWLE